MAAKYTKGQGGFDARADAVRHPSRLLANALVNVGWRNGPIEDVHAGLEARLRLDERRLTSAEERHILRQAADTFDVGMTVGAYLGLERPRPWSEQVLPFGLVPFWGVTPTGWSLTEGAPAGNDTAFRSSAG